MNKSNNDKNNKIVRILSLDGGGTRGYIQAKFLELFCKDAGINDLGEYFDLIAGTSIGGINAVAFASGMKPTDLVKFFREKSPWIFTIRNKKDIFSNNASIPSNTPNKWQMLYMIGTSNPFYKSVSQKSNYGDARLHKELKNVFGDKLLNQVKTKVLLPAYNLSNCTPIVFTNVNLDNISNAFVNVKIVDALMATASFPTYFPSVKLKLSNNFANVADGGLFQYNPSVLALIVAKHCYPSANKYCILSIGTGIRQSKLKFDEGKNIIYNLLPIKYTRLWDIFMQSSKTTCDTLLNTLGNDIDSNINYYRFNVNLDTNKECGLDTSTSNFFDYLDNIVELKYKENIKEIKQFISNINSIK